MQGTKEGCKGTTLTLAFCFAAFSALILSTSCLQERESSDSCVMDVFLGRCVCPPARSSLAFSRNSLPARAAACNIMRCVYPFFGWGRDLYHGDGEMAASHFFASSFFLRFSARFASTSPIAARTRRQRNATTARTGRGAFLFSQKRQHGNNNNWLYLPLQ